MRFKALFSLLLVSASFSLTLDEAIKLGLKNNPQLKAYLQKSLSAKEDFYSQLAGRFGEVSVLWTYNQYKFPRVVAPISSLPMVRDDQVRIYGFEYKVRLFDGCGQFFLIKAKRELANAGWLEYLKEAKNLEKSVKEAYYSYLIAKAKLEAAKKEEEATAELYRIVREAYKLGKRPLVDLLQVSASLEGVRSKVASLKAELRSKEEELKRLLGVEKLPSLPERVEVNPKPLKENELLPTLLGKNLDLRLVKVQRKVADDYRRVAFSQFLPKVDFLYRNLKYSYADRKTSDWSYTLSVSMPIFDFGRRFFTYRKALHEERRIKNLQRETENRILEAFRSLVAKLNAQFEVIGATEEKLRFAKEAYEVERTRYLTGKGNVYDLLKAKALYFDSLAQREEAIYSWAILKAELDYLLSR